MLKADISTTTDAEADEARAARLYAGRLPLAELPSMAGDGRLLRVMTHRIATLFHPLEDLRWPLPVEVVAPGGRRLAMRVLPGGEAVIATTGMEAGGEVRLRGIDEVRAVAALLNAAVAAVEAHDALRDFDDEAAAMAEREAEAGRKMTRKRRT